MTNVNALLSRRGAPDGAPLWLGTVAAVGAGYVTVVLDGADTPVTAKGAADGGDRVMLTRIGRVMYVLSQIDTSGAAPGISPSLIDAEGDLIVGAADNTPTRLAVGPDGTFLMADSSAPGGLSYGAAAASGRVEALMPTTLNPTYGDHFDGASLNARWNRVGYVAGDEAYQQGGGTYLQIGTARGAGNYYWQAAPAGNFTIVACLSLMSATGVMFGPMILDNSGAGVVGCAYNAPEGLLIGTVAGGGYTGPFTGLTTILASYAYSGARIFHRLRKVSGNYLYTLSPNGDVWAPEVSIASGITPTRIGFGCANNTPVSFAIDFFDVQ